MQPPIGAVDVFLVQRPADALRGTTLILPFDIGRVDRSACVLHHKIAQNRGSTGLGINFDINHMRAKAGTNTLSRHLMVTRDRPPG